MTYKHLAKLYYSDSIHYESKYKERFESELSIKLPIEIHESIAFFTIPMEMVNKIEKIYKCSNDIHKVLYKLPQLAVNFLINKALKDEISITNEIEGIRSTRKEVEDAVLSQNSNRQARFKGLAAKYIKLIRDEKIPMHSCADIRKLYDDIVACEIDDENKPDGIYFRKEMVQVVSSTQKEKHRGVIPEEKIISYMDASLDFVRDEHISTLIKTAAFHYLFGYIHPFYDGNGRMSRFISSCLIKDDLGVLLSLRLSYVIKNNLKTYYRAFDICNDRKNKGEITSFILMFLDLLEEANEDLYRKLHSLNEQLSYYHDIIQKMNMKKKKENLVYILCQNALFEDTFMSLEELILRLHSSNTAVRNLLRNLTKENLLITSKQGRKILYSANLDTLELWNEI